MKIYQVGGSVRDGLLGLPVVDRDWVVVGSTPTELQALGFRQVGRDFPVYLHPKTHEEYALARTERKQGRGYHGFTFDTSVAVTLEQDLARRDLTINAMALTDDGTLIDPYGGATDLAARTLRHITPAFAEDPLRVLRVARFAARFDFSVAPDTLSLMRDIAHSGELATLSPERVWRELERALGEPYPHRFIEVLRACDALRAIFPEIDRLFGVPQRADYHPEIDTGIHLLLTLQVSARVAAPVAVRFALLMHDLGKALTPVAQLPSHPGHEAASAQLANEFCQRWRVPIANRELAVLVAKYHLKIHCIQELRAATIVTLLEDLDAFRRPARIDDILLGCELDYVGRGDAAPRPYPQATLLRQALAACAALDQASIVRAHTSGEAIKRALTSARVKAVRQTLGEGSAHSAR